MNKRSNYDTNTLLVFFCQVCGYLDGFLFSWLTESMMMMIIGRRYFGDRVLAAEEEEEEQQHHLRDGKGDKCRC